MALFDASERSKSAGRRPWGLRPRWLSREDGHRRPTTPVATGADGAADTGIYLFGMVRGAAHRGAPLRDFGGEFLWIRHRGLVALAQRAPFDLPPLERPDVLAHQRVVERVMRRGTILPAPPGVVFSGQRPLLRFLADQYLALEDALAFVDGHWEIRLHVAPSTSDADPDELSHLATHIYAELRRHARAAVPFPREDERLLSAAFLVDRGAWVEFVERAEDLGAAHRGLALDVTGPWPPYDFVRIVF